MVHQSTHRRRAAMYMIVLMTAMLVTVIGLGGLMAARTQFRIGQANNDAMQARFYAKSAIDLALYELSVDANWRTNLTNDTWEADRAMDVGVFRWKPVDELDGNLSNDASDEIRIYGTGVVGDTVRTYSVLLETEGGQRLAIRVATGDDDGEARSGDGFTYLDSSDLELPYDANSTWESNGELILTNIVGLRFTNVNISQGESIQSAHVQFQVDDVDSGAASMTIRGEDTDDASPFTTSSYNISSRTTTSASVAWSPPVWNVVDAAGVPQRTADISSIIQEIVDRPAWSAGNALVIIITGTGTRSAESYDGKDSAAPLLRVRWGTSGPLTPVSGSWRREVGP